MNRNYVASSSAILVLTVSLLTVLKANDFISDRVGYVDLSTWTSEYASRHGGAPKPPSDRAVPFPPDQHREQREINFVTFHFLSESVDSVAQKAIEKGHLPADVNQERKENYTLGSKIWFDHVQKGWKSVAYHYLIGNSGKIYKGRPDNIAPGSNTFYYPRGYFKPQGGNYVNGDSITSESDEERGALIPLEALSKNSGDFRSRIKKSQALWEKEIGSRIEDKDAVAPGETQGHITICFLVGGSEEPSAPAFESAINLATHLLFQHNLEIEDIRCHREVSTSTACPGPAVYKWLRGTALNSNHAKEGLGISTIKSRLKELRKEEGLE